MMKDDLEYEFTLLYEKWLMETCLEDIHNKDDLIDKSCYGYMYEEFIEELKKVM